MRVIVLHDNPDWFQPIRNAFDEHCVTVEEWVSDEMQVDVSKPPPADAIFYNRCSASAHTRGRPRSLDQARTILRWLELYGRVVVNGLVAAELENSKAFQYLTAARYGMRAPRTILTAKPSLEVVERQIGKSQPFLIKPDRGGRGANIKFYSHVEEFEKDGEALESITGLHVVQEFVRPADGVYRVEMVGQRYLYTSLAIPLSPGGFDPNMCPCELPESRFRVLTDFSHPVLEMIDKMFKGSGLENGAVEFILDEDGEARVVDINTNTAYNRDAELSAGAEEGWKAVVQYVVNRLRQVEENGLRKAIVDNDDSNN